MKHVKRLWGTVALVAAGVMLLVGAAPAQDPAPPAPTYSLGTPTDLLDAAFYAGQPEDESDVAGRQAFWGSSSHDGKTVAFYAVNTHTQMLAVFLVDMGDPSSWRRLIPDVAALPSQPIHWTPDDLYLIVGPYRIPLATGEMAANIIHDFSMNDSSMTQLPADNWLVTYAPSGRPNADLVALPIWRDGQADPEREPVILTNLYSGGVRCDWPFFAQDGSKIAFANYAGGAPGSPDLGDIYVLKNVPSLIVAPKAEGTQLSSLAPSALTDTNIIPIHTTEDANYTHVPSFSEDLSLVFFAEDMNNVFRNNDFYNTLALADFDVVIAKADGSGEEVVLSAPGNQMLAGVTPGGVRVLYMAAVSDAMHLYITTLDIATGVVGTQQGEPVDNDIETTEAQEASDASGTVVSIPSGVLIDFPAGAPQEIQISTPVEVNETPLLPGVQGVPVVREFGPDGTNFNPPITITISYADAEVEGFDEGNLKVFTRDTESGVYDIEVTTITTRDLVNNTISFTVDHFSSFSLGAEIDTDGDGIPDGDDPDDDNDGIPDGEDANPLDTDNDGIDNADDPDDDDDGIPDGDDAYALDAENDPLGHAVYHSLGDFGSVQGEHNWYYMYYDRADDTYKEMTWSEAGQRWESPGGAWIWREQVRSKVSNDVVRAWRAPAGGTVRISSIYWLGIASFGGDYTDSTIEINDRRIWGPSRTHPEIAEVYLYDLREDVELGDWIYFRVDSGRENDDGDMRSFLPRIAFTPDYQGITYVDFDDGQSGALATTGTLTGGGTVQIANGQAHIVSKPIVPGAWAGAQMCYGEMSIMKGDFSAQVLLPDAGQVLTGSDITYAGIMVEVAGTVENDGDGESQYAFCGVGKNDEVGSNQELRMVQVGFGAEYTLPGELVSATDKIGVRVVRNGDTLELWAAYDADAPLEGQPTTGTFHLINSQTISGPVIGIYVFTYRNGDTVTSFDDFYLTGTGIMNYVSPETGPVAPENVHVENDTGLVGSVTLLSSPVWSHDGKKVAFIGQLYHGLQKGIHVYDFMTQSVTTLVSEGDEVFNTMTHTGMAWSPDDESLYFTSMVRDHHHESLIKCSSSTPNQILAPGQMEIFIKGSDISGDIEGTIYSPCVLKTETGYKLLFCMGLDECPSNEYFYNYWGVRYWDMDEQGNLIGESHKVLWFDSYSAVFSGLSVSSTGDQFVMAVAQTEQWSAENTVYLVTGLRDIMAGTSATIDNYNTDPRVRIIDGDHSFKTWPRFSQDGTRIFFNKDFSGRFFQTAPTLRNEWHGFGNSFECDFDIMSTTVADVLASVPPTRIPKWGNQLRVEPSEGGTRLVWVDDSFNYLVASTLRFTKNLALAGGVTTDDFELPDGSGTTLNIPAGTTVTGMADPGATTIPVSVYTPISPIQEAILDVGGVPVVRKFAPSGLFFQPSGSMTIHYGDAEVRGLDEETLEVLHMPESGEPQALPISERNTDENYVVIPVPGFSQFGVGGNFLPGYDGDEDGLEDRFETMDLDPDTPGVQNPFNPYVTDATGNNFDPNPDGIPDGQNDWDGDGISNEDEFRLGSNPIDPESMPPMPLAALPIAGVLLAAGVLTMRRRRNP
jgi:hypothetical protein